jgi:hypothetical protein
MMLKSTLDAERERLDGLEAAATRLRFACLSRCDFAGATKAWFCVKCIRKAKAALITGELFPEENET